MLALEDERVLLKDWQVSKDKFALESLVLSHARIVFYWARKLSDDQAEREDLISEGILGLIHAADLFDLDRDVRFSTYAKWWVKNATMTARNHRVPSIAPRFCKPPTWPKWSSPSPSSPPAHTCRSSPSSRLHSCLCNESFSGHHRFNQ